MSTAHAAEASLINGAEFLDELEHSGHLDEHLPDPGFASPVYADAFDALESGLPMTPAAARADRPHHERAPIDEKYGLVDVQPALAEKGIPFMAAALVLAACLTAGAATAAIVFHDRVTQITATGTASR